MTLALASLAIHFHFLHVAHAFLGLGGDGASILLGALAVVELIADKIPVVDHSLHVLHIGVKPVLAAILVNGTLPEMGPGDVGTYAFAGLAALNAFGVHTGVATLRGASSTMTLGFANPIVSFVEDIASILATLLAIALPIVGALVAVLLTLAILVMARAIVRRLRARRPVTMASA
jgi:hypothetical protein